MAFAFGPLLFVIDFGPRTNPDAALGPQMDGMAQDFVALVADVNPVNLAGLETDRSGAGDALQSFGVLEAIGVAADFPQEARPQSLGRARQRAKQVMVGMLFEQGFNLLAVLVELELQGLEQPCQAQGQQALGRGHGGGTAELAGVLEDFQPLGGRLRSPELLGVEELFPAPLSGGDQFFRGGELDDKVPAPGLRPILEGLEGRRIILDQGLLELVDQGGALFDQADLVSAQQLQLPGQRIQRPQGFPLLAIRAQGLRQRPGIQPVGFGAAGRFALAIAFGAERVDRINAAVHLQELIHSGSLTGFYGDPQGGIGLNLLSELLPAFQGMLDAEVGDDLTLAIHDDDIMVVAGPVEAGVVSDFIEQFHHFAFGCSHRGAVGSHSDTGSLVGCCSLRHYDSRC